MINLGSETKLYDYFKKKKIKTYFIWLKNLPLNKWAAKINESIGHRAITKEIKDIDETIAINTVGDTIIQVHYPKSITKKLKTFFEKYSSTQEMSMKEITQIAHSKCEIKFVVYKNKEMARNFNEKYLKYFN